MDFCLCISVGRACNVIVFLSYAWLNNLYTPSLKFNKLASPFMECEHLCVPKSYSFLKSGSLQFESVVEILAAVFFLLFIETGSEAKRFCASI